MSIYLKEIKKEEWEEMARTICEIKRLNVKLAKLAGGKMPVAIWEKYFQRIGKASRMYSVELEDEMCRRNRDLIGNRMFFEEN